VFRWTASGPEEVKSRLLLMSKKLPAVHPGEVLRKVLLVPIKLSPYAVAPLSRRCARTKAFRTTPTFWMDLQVQYDIERAEDEG
jgi:antitoxin HigA-1